MHRSTTPTMLKHATVAALSLFAAGCAVDLGGFAFMNDKSVSASVSLPVREPMLQADGTCDPPLPEAVTVPAAVELGMGECALVRLKGQPTDVLVGEGSGRREVQVLYSLPGGKEVYLFADNKLIRVVQ